jgi:hypothetical protein
MARSHLSPCRVAGPRTASEPPDLWRMHVLYGAQKEIKHLTARQRENALHLRLRYSVKHYFVPIIVRKISV